ncbi:Protein involved in initiation of plasmid replication [Candidatus Burkholderia verschuerenii]|uniref:Protein involved in initiation of plasmid replication n=1 Tax=Candidatus Burkholderia verschuerenii TaxID=242163 RepID=A0A0L0M5H8_9BURK|nr:Protein involved in initiation of plasmid replication [Candidatus Burkholderia verschuerenii]
MASSVERRVTSLQYALDLFVENAPVKTPIDAVASGKDIGYQKNSVFARIIGLGLSARRFVDAAYFIVAQEPEISDTYEVSLNFFKWLMRYESHNKKHFSSVVRSVKSAMLEVTSGPVVSVDAKGRLLEDRADPSEADEDADDLDAQAGFVSVTDDEGDWLELIGRVSVRNGRIRFRVPLELQRLIKDPENSYWTSLLVTSKFKLIYARAIYDHVLPEVPHERTEWISLDLIRSLPGKSWANFAEFKYFKRDYLEPAIKHINELSDIEIAYETRAGTPGSRKKDQIRFKLRRKEEASAADADMLSSASLYLTLYKEFGLSDKQFVQIRENRGTWTDARIEQAIDYVRWRIAKGDDIRRASSYLMKALAENYRVAEADKQISLLQTKRVEKEAAKDVEQGARKGAVAASVAAAEAAADQRRQDEVRAAREYFASAEKKAQEDLVRRFVASSTIGQRTIERQGLKALEINENNILTWPSIAGIFASFVAAELRKAARKSA